MTDKQADKAKRQIDSLYHSEKLVHITDSIRLYPDSSRFYFERAGLLYVMKKYDLAKKDLQKALTIDPGKALYYQAMGELHLSINQPDSAILDYRKAIQLNPDGQQSRLQLSYILLQQEKYQETISETKTLLKHNPDLAEALGLQSQAYQALEDTAKAIEIMKKAILLAPENYDALMAMGDLLMKNKNDDAVKYYGRAQKVDTTSGEPLFSIGLFYEARGQVDQAIAAYNQSINRDAYYLDAYIRSGKLYEEKKEWEKALGVFNLAIKISPTSSQAFYHRGICNEKLNNISVAIEDYNQAVVLDEDNKPAQAALKRLGK